MLTPRSELRKENRGCAYIQLKLVANFSIGVINRIFVEIFAGFLYGRLRKEEKKGGVLWR